LYGFISGFVVGWVFAVLRNAVTFIYLAAVYRRWQLRLLLAYC